MLLQTNPDPVLVVVWSSVMGDLKLVYGVQSPFNVFERGIYFKLLVVTKASWNLDEWGGVSHSLASYLFRPIMLLVAVNCKP